MPNDLYRWEDGGALVHHCPVCHHPLSSERSRTKCLGIHVEWCKMYHPQLFRIGGSGSCMACINSEQKHESRHRNVAELARRLKAVQNDESCSSVAASPAPSAGRGTPTGTSKTKREKREEKRAARAARRPKVITSEDVRFVALSLHPHAEDEEEETDLGLLQDEDIQAHLPFHRGTSGDSGVRKALVASERGKKNFTVSEEEVARSSTALGVQDSRSASREERDILKQLKDDIRGDLLSTGRERQETMKRKCGFWRWASKRAFNNLAQKSLLWDWRDGGLLAGQGEGAWVEEAQGQEAQEEEAQEQEAQEQEAQEQEAQGQEAQEQEAQGQEAQEQEAQELEAQGQEVQEQEAQGQEAQELEAQGQEAQGQEAQEQEAQGQEAQEQEAQEQEAQEPEAQNGEGNLQYEQREAYPGADFPIDKEEGDGGTSGEDRKGETQDKSLGGQDQEDEEPVVLGEEKPPQSELETKHGTHEIGSEPAQKDTATATPQNEDGNGWPTSSGAGRPQLFFLTPRQMQILSRQPQ